MSSERRAPVQGDRCYKMMTGHSARRPDSKPPGTIAWSEHLAVYERYRERYGDSQSAERLAERGGFGFREIEMLTGAEPRTWLPR